MSFVLGFIERMLKKYAFFDVYSAKMCKNGNKKTLHIKENAQQNPGSHEGIWACLEDGQNRYPSVGFEYF